MKWLIVTLYLFGIPFTVFGGDPLEIAGHVRTVKGTAYIIHNGQQQAAAPGQNIYPSDQLQTGDDSSMGVVLKDSTVISLGPETTFVVERFRFDPQKRTLGLWTKMIRGTVAYISGTIAKLAPESVKFETPDAVIGIRGTKFLVKVD